MVFKFGGAFRTKGGIFVPPENVTPDNPPDNPPPDPNPNFNALPPSDSIAAWEAAMKTYGQPHIDSPHEAGSSVYNDERSPLYYDGAHNFHMQEDYWTNYADTPDLTYAAGAASLSDHLWDEYVSIYGTIDGSNPSDGYRKQSQWVFAESADRESAPHLLDMISQSCYAAYLDGHQDAYNDSDARGLGYLTDVYCRYKRNTGNEIITYGRNQLEHLAPILETYCSNLGPVDGKTKEIYFQLGVLGFMMMQNQDILDTYGINTRDCVENIIQYINSKCEAVGDDQYRLQYGDGYIPYDIYGGGVGNEATLYYPGLEMVCIAMYKWFPSYQAYADGLWMYAVENVDLTLDKDYAEHYRFSLPYIMDRGVAYASYSYTPANPATEGVRFASLDGTDDDFAFGDQWGMTASEPAAIAFKLRRTDAGAAGDHILFYEDSNGTGVKVAIESNGLAYYRYDGSYYLKVSTAADTLTLDTFHNWVITDDGSGTYDGVHIYRDNVELTLSEDNNTLSSGSDLTPSGGTLYVGHNGDAAYAPIDILELFIWDVETNSATRESFDDHTPIREEPVLHVRFNDESGTTATATTGSNGTLTGDDGSGVWQAIENVGGEPGEWFDFTTVGSGTSVEFDYNPSVTTSILDGAGATADDTDTIGTIEDQSGNSRNAVQASDTYRLTLDSDGMNGQPGIVGGTTTFMTIENSLDLLQNASAATFVFAIKHNANSAYQGILQQYTNTGGNDRFHFYLDDTSKINVKFRNPDATVNDQYTNDTLTDATIQVVVITIDCPNQLMEIWVSGTKVHTAALTGTSNFSNSAAGAVACLFAMEQYSGNEFAGTMGRMAMLSEKLDDADVGTVSTGVAADYA